MKRTLIIVLSVLLFAALFVSCSDKPEPNFAATVTFKNVGAGEINGTFYIKSQVETKTYANLSEPVVIYSDEACTKETTYRVVFFANSSSNSIAVYSYDGNGTKAKHESFLMRQVNFQYTGMTFVDGYTYIPRGTFEITDGAGVITFNFVEDFKVVSVESNPEP